MNTTPHIDEVAWGRIQVAGFGVFKDAKVWPGGARVWDWRETDTHHVPGIQFADVEELLARGAQEVVLSRGMLLALHVQAAALDELERRGIPVHVLETRKAVRKLNELRTAKPVAGLLHSTC